MLEIMDFIVRIFGAVSVIALSIYFWKTERQEFKKVMKFLIIGVGYDD